MNIGKKAALFLFLLLTLASVLACKSISRLLNSGSVSIAAKFESESPNEPVSAERVVSVLQKRLDSLGINGEVTSVSESEIHVKLYGGKGADGNTLERLKKLLFVSYQLELKAVVSNSYPSPISTYINESEAKSKATADQEVLPYNEREDTGVQYLIVHKKAIVSGNDVMNAKAVLYPGYSDSEDGFYGISFSLNPDGATRFGNWTGKNIYNYLAIVLNK